MSETKKAFDLEAVYDAEIAPLMAQIIEVCKTHKLPMFATFLYANDPESEEDGVCTTNLMFGERPIPEKLFTLARIIMGTSAPAMRLTVRNKDGQVTEQTVILP